MVDNQSPVIPFLSFPVAKIIGGHGHVWIFTWVLGIKLGSSCLCTRHLTYWSISQLLFKFFQEFPWPWSQQLLVMKTNLHLLMEIQCFIDIYPVRCPSTDNIPLCARVGQLCWGLGCKLSLLNWKTKFLLNLNSNFGCPINTLYTLACHLKYFCPFCQF